MRIFFSKSALLAVALAFTAPLAAQDEDCLTEAKTAAEEVSGGALSADNCLFEDLRRDAPVSNPSSRVRGVISRNLFDGGFKAEMRVLEVQVATPGALCIQYRGRDGRYSGSQNFTVNRAGWVRIPFNTEHGAALEELGPAGFAVQAEIASACADRTGRRLAPVRTQGTNKKFVLLAQIGTADAHLEIYIDEDDKPDIEQPCRSISQPNTVRFDTACFIPSGAFEKEALTNLNIRGGGRFNGEAVLLANIKNSIDDTNERK